MTGRTCNFIKENGEQCRAAPLQDGDFCRMHDPASAREVSEARRLGGLRRRREKVTAVVYGWGGLESVGQIRRLISIAVIDTLSLENSVARSRTLAYLAMVGLKALEVGDMEERLVALEQAIGPRLEKGGGRR